MKALVISVSILLVLFFSNTAAFGQSSAQSTEQKEEAMKETENKKTTAVMADANSATDINSIADVNAFNDPNGVKERIREFRGLSGDLSLLNRGSRNCDSMTAIHMAMNESRNDSPMNWNTSG